MTNVGKNPRGRGVFHVKTRGSASPLNGAVNDSVISAVGRTAGIK